MYSNKSGIKNDICDSLEYYEIQAAEHIRKYLPIAIIKNRKDIKDAKLKKIIHYILDNDDLFSNMTTAIMIADFTHDSNRGSLRHWRTQNCMWTLNRTFYKNKIRPETLNNNISEAFNYAVEPSYNQTPFDDILQKEEYTILDEKIDSLEQKEKEILRLYYQDNLTEKEIGKIYSITQQRVSKILIQAKRRLHNESRI